MGGSGTHSPIPVRKTLCQGRDRRRCGGPKVKNRARGVDLRYRVFGSCSHRVCLISIELGKLSNNGYPRNAELSHRLCRVLSSAPAVTFQFVHKIRRCGSSERGKILCSASSKQRINWFLRCSAHCQVLVCEPFDRFEADELRAITSQLGSQVCKGIGSSRSHLAIVVLEAHGQLWQHYLRVLASATEILGSIAALSPAGVAELEGQRRNVDRPEFLRLVRGAALFGRWPQGRTDLIRQVV
mmetsp:Transcript_42916/g.100758  ORF Transcript_42916/g.100758 Transcript_42916/m.100758 type:complete len:241 (-) Transcript_42916:308-1030(-)